jgi:hypothetical protein
MKVSLIAQPISHDLDFSDPMTYRVEISRIEVPRAQVFHLKGAEIQMEVIEKQKKISGEIWALRQKISSGSAMPKWLHSETCYSVRNAITGRLSDPPLPAFSDTDGLSSSVAAFCHYKRLNSINWAFRTEQ